MVSGLYGGNWNSVGYPEIADTNRRAAAFCTEAICVFFLVTGVLNVATTKVQANNNYYGRQDCFSGTFFTVKMNEMS